MPIDIIGSRLRNQRLCASRLPKPEDIVGWLGAVQAQEYTDTKWALGLRMRRASDDTIERAFTAGRILRTHVLRPTWHFVTPDDIRWMLALTGPRVSRAMTPYNRRLELDAAIFRRSRHAIVKALSGGKQLTRQELKAVLRRAGVNADGVQRLAHIVMQAELDGIVCSGARRGRQFTYALLDERVPASRSLSRDAALAELAQRYFTGHGPAQVRDFAWWSWLTAADARHALALVAKELSHEIIDGKTYWFAASVRSLTLPSPTAYLLPPYDEYVIAYKDRSAALDLSRWTRRVFRDPFTAPIVIDGRVAGGWRKTLQGDSIAVSLTPYRRFNRRETAAVADAARSYAAFFRRNVTLLWR